MSGTVGGGGTVCVEVLQELRVGIQAWLGAYVAVR